MAVAPGRSSLSGWTNFSKLAVSSILIDASLGHTPLRLSQITNSRRHTSRRAWLGDVRDSGEKDLSELTLAAKLLKTWRNLRANRACWSERISSKDNKGLLPRHRPNVGATIKPSSPTWHDFVEKPFQWCRVARNSVVVLATGTRDLGLLLISSALSSSQTPSCQSFPNAWATLAQRCRFQAVAPPYTWK